LDQKDNLGLTTSSNLLARRSALFSILSNVGNTKLQPTGTISHPYDRRLSKIFKDNIRIIALLSKHFGVKPLFVPQILNYRKLTADKPYGWMPFVNDSDVKELMSSMNADLADTAREMQVPYLGDVLNVDGEDADFVDNGHFSPAGAVKFAQAIAPRASNECR
jgi:hypothetical protein